MVAAAAILERAGIHVDPAEFDRLVAAALSAVVPLRPAPDPVHELSSAEQAVLLEGGFSLEPLAPDRTHPVARTAAAYAALLGSSLSVAEAARWLGINQSRVRQRLAARTLYGIKEMAEWRLPRFQFDERRAVRGTERVLPRLDAALHPLAVVGWFTTPHPDLVPGEDEAPMSPREWLRAGHPVELVAERAADLDVLA